MCIYKLYIYFITQLVGLYAFTSKDIINDNFNLDTFTVHVNIGCFTLEYINVIGHCWSVSALPVQTIRALNHHLTESPYKANGRFKVNSRESD